MKQKVASLQHCERLFVIAHKRMIMRFVCLAKPCNMSNWMLARDKDRNHTKRTSADPHLRLIKAVWALKHFSGKDREQIKAETSITKRMETEVNWSILFHSYRILSLNLSCQLDMRTANSLDRLTYLIYDVVCSVGCNTDRTGGYCLQAIHTG